MKDGIVQQNNYICHCMKVSVEQIRNCVSEGCKTVEEVGKCTNASTACTACHKKILKIIEEELK